jgi:putative addiction module CopG family antidote
VLDIGCGSGFYLAALREAGWDGEGIEPGETAAQFARKHCGLPVHNSNAEEALAACRDGSFDLVTMWHVLEHLPDPAKVLAEVRRILRPGGTLMLEVPNFSSIWSVLFFGAGGCGTRRCRLTSVESFDSGADCFYAGRMEVRLTDDQKAFIRHAVETGRYAREEDVVKEALSLWEERERTRAEILAQVDLTETSLARSEGRIITRESMRALAEEVRQRGRARLANDKRRPTQ